LVAGALIHVAEETQTRREVAERDHTENVGKWPLDESGKDPVNENGEKIRAPPCHYGTAVSVIASSPSLRAKRSNPESLSGKILDCFGA
jgi:hypothetical protein